jgi:hypothetical protein
MSRHHKHKHPLPTKDKLETHPSRRRVIIGLLSLLVLAVLVAVVLKERSSRLDQTATNQRASDGSKTEVLFRNVVHRTYAIDKLFRKVYSAGWEGANGAIGDAHLFAATGDQGLLYSFTNTYKMQEMFNGTWVDDRAWICLAEMYWWDFAGRKNTAWVADAKQRYLQAKKEGRLSYHEGFWSWYNWPPNAVPSGENLITNSNMNQMATAACMLYAATGDRQFYDDAVLIWDGDGKYPGVERMFYKGNGRWEGKSGLAAFGEQFPWQGAGYCSIGAALYRMTGNKKFRDVAVSIAKRVMDPTNGWVDGQDYYQVRMDGNGAFVHYILDAYMIAPEELPDIPIKVEEMLEHVWSNHHGSAALTLHQTEDDGIRNGWNPNGGEDGYGVNEVGTVHAQSQAVRAFGVFAYVLRQQLTKEQSSANQYSIDTSK